MSVMVAVVIWGAGFGLLALWLDRRRRRRERMLPAMSALIHVPDGWDVYGLMLIDDEGHAQFVSLEDPVAAAERVTREAS